VSLLRQIRSWWHAPSAARETVSRAVTCDDLGITQSGWMGDRESQERLRWDDVGRVLAYKRDCYIVDQIRVALPPFETNLTELYRPPPPPTASAP